MSNNEKNDSNPFFAKLVVNTLREDVRHSTGFFRVDSGDDDEDDDTQQNKNKNNNDGNQTSSTKQQQQQKNISSLWVIPPPSPSVVDNTEFYKRTNGPPDLDSPLLKIWNAQRIASFAVRSITRAVELQQTTFAWHETMKCYGQFLFDRELKRTIEQNQHGFGNAPPRDLCGSMSHLTYVLSEIGGASDSLMALQLARPAMVSAVASKTGSDGGTVTYKEIPRVSTKLSPENQHVTLAGTKEWLRQRLEADEAAYHHLNDNNVPQRRQNHFFAVEESDDYSREASMDNETTQQQQEQERKKNDKATKPYLFDSSDDDDAGDAEQKKKSSKVVVKQVNNNLRDSGRLFDDKDDDDNDNDQKGFEQQHPLG